MSVPEHTTMQQVGGKELQEERGNQTSLTPELPTMWICEYL